MTELPGNSLPEKRLIRLAEFCFRHRRLVLGIWCIVLLAALAIGRIVPPSYRADYQTPGAEATEVFDLLAERFTDRKGDSIYLVFSASEGIDGPAHRERIESLLAEVEEFPHVTSVDSPFDFFGSMQRAPNGTTAFAMVNLDRTIDKLTNLDRQYQKKFLNLVNPGTREGLAVEVSHFVSSMALGNETIALFFATLVLLIAFGSLFATGLPILTALFGLGVGTVLGGCLTHLVESPDWAATVATMIGLGVGIDYALFIVTRYRAGLGEGLDPQKAVVKAMATAGRTVLFAGCTVVFSLIGMLAMRLSYVNGVFVLSAVAVTTMLAASLTLLPAVLGFVGRKIDRFRIPFVGAGNPTGDQGFWYRWSRSVQKKPWTALVAGTIAMAVFTLPIFSLRSGLPDDGNRPEEETSRRAYDLLTEGFGPGFNGPLLLFVDTRDAIDSGPVVDKLEAALRAADGVAFVAPTLMNPERDSAIMGVYADTSPQAKETEQLVKNLRRNIIPPIVSGTGIRALVGGFTAISIDQANYIMNRLPWFIGAVVLLSFFLLTVVFRSPVVALKAGILNLVGIAAAYGVMAYAVNGTWLGRILNIPETPVPAFVPMIMFAVLFGLSMDYEVFLLSRIREEYDRSGDNSRSVADGLAVTARVITAAAAIMVFVFGIFIFDPNVFIKQIGLGLTVAVLVDVTLVRIVLVPATMELLGKANWWMPKWLDRMVPNMNRCQNGVSLPRTENQEEQPENKIFERIQDEDNLKPIDPAPPDHPRPTRPRDH